MDPRHCKMRMNLEGDRLSSLPDDLIHTILSFIGIKHAIQTSALSSRWRFIWTSLPYLNFSTEDFSTLPKFSKFVTHVLSNRNTKIEVSFVKLRFRGKVSQVFIKRILNYAFSHNVEQITVTCLADKNKIEFPLSLFSSQSLKHLTMVGAGHGYYQSITPTSTWELPALTTLYLKYINFDDVIIDKCNGLFSKCPNLKNLTLNHCRISGSNDVDICHPGLSNLTLENGHLFNNVSNVVAPQLKNIIIREWSRVHLLSAPMLASLVFKGSSILHLSPNGLCSLEKADLCIYKPYYKGKSDKTYAHKIVDLLRQVCNVKFLTLNMEAIQLLSLFKELIAHKPSPFANLKSIKVYPHNAFSKVEESMPSEVKKYLLDNSSGATITLVLCEEMRAMKNAELAENLMAEFQVLLEQEKANIKTIRAPMERGRTPLKNQKAKLPEKEEAEIDKWGRMLEIDSCWKDLSVQIKQEKTKTHNIISKLRCIEKLLTELPASKKTKIETCFASLCEEAENVMNKRMDCMKIKCDEKLRSKAVRLSNLEG